MTGANQTLAADAREAARRRLRRLTLGLALGSVGGVAVLGGVAAATLPGHAETDVPSSTTTTTGAVTDTGGSNDTDIQAPSAAPQNGIGGRAHAVSGGSR